MEMLFSGKAVEIDRVVSGDKHYTEEFVRLYEDLEAQLKVGSFDNYERIAFDMMRNFVVMMNYHWEHSKDKETSVYRLAKSCVEAIKGTEYMLEME